MTFKTIATAAIFSVALAGTAVAQNDSNRGNSGNNRGLVVVSVSNVANDLAENLNVQASDVADVGSVQVPISVAAAVCELEVNAIASSNDRGEKSCDAQSTNDALNGAVQQALNDQTSTSQ